MRNINAIFDGPFRHGVEVHMPREQYREACGLNPSSLKQPSPLHVKYAYENQSESTDAMRLGTAVHTLCWEPHRFSDDIAVWEGTRRGKEWESFRDDNDGKTIIKAEQLEIATRIASALTANPMVRELAREGCAEVAVFTEECGLQCRGMLDWIATHLGVLADLKVVNSIEPRRFGNAVQSYGWDISMACYKRWLQREANKEIKAVKFIAVESKPPHDVAVVTVDDQTLENGWLKAATMIRRVRVAIESGVWPGIAGTEELPLYVPNWCMEEPELVGEFDQ